MSLQRIFESARKLGLPVVVTDPAGREPMVVLSLEQFEAMAESAETEPKDRPPVASHKSSKAGVQSHEHSSGYHSEEQLSPVNQAQSRIEQVEPVLEEIPTPTQSKSEISLDERFYLEPLEDSSAG